MMGFHELMETMTRQWAAKRNIPLRFLSFQSGEEVLFEASENGFPFDLLIIDIDMKGMNGIELARNIRKIDGSLPICNNQKRKSCFRCNNSIELPFVHGFLPSVHFLRFFHMFRCLYLSSAITKTQ